MKPLAFALGLVAFGTLLLAGAPTSSAVAYCVHDVKEPVPYDDCDGLACVGYNQSGWQNCVPPDVYCLYRTDCCYYQPSGGFYCP